MIKRVISTFNCIKISHVRREGNIPAHILIMLACDLEEIRIWIDESPDYVIPAVLGNLNERRRTSFFSKKKKKKKHEK